MSPRQLIIKLLDRWEQTDIYADVLLEDILRDSTISQQDRVLVQEIFFGVIRWRQKLNWILEQFFQGKFAKSPRFVRHILQSALYQLMFLNRVPHYAVINEAVKLARSKGGHYWAKKINAILRTYLRQKDEIVFPDQAKNAIESISVQYSHPQWLVQRWIDRWGREETVALCQANNERPRLSLRVNRLKITPEQLRNILSEYDIKAELSPDSDDFLTTRQLPDLSRFKPFQQGLFTIQDESAGLACRLLAPLGGERIVDLCAAPGGKTTYLNELSDGKARVFSVDQNFFRLKLVKQNLKRLGFNDTRLIQADGRNFFCREMDKVLVDVPCSGLGVLSKRVDLRWKRTEAQIKELTDIQFALLLNASALIRKGGTIVYSTCTIEPDENEYVVNRFLNEKHEFQIDAAQKYVPEKFVTKEGFIYTYPHKHGIDGSFAVRLVKK